MVRDLEIEELLKLARDTITRLKKQKAAKDSLRAFCEYISPDLPPAKHHRLLIKKLEAVERGECRRLMVFMPPGSAKSTYTSLRFPAWFLGRQPGRTIIAASHTGDLATSFGRKVRNLVGSDEYRQVFDLGLSRDSKAANEWSMPGGREYKAVGVGGSITGRRSACGVIDDPVKGREEADSPTVREKVWQWYLSDFRTRLIPGAPIVLVLTRWHEDDLAGRILPEKWSGESRKVIARDGEEWDVLVIQAVAEAGIHDPLGRAVGDPLWPEWFEPGHFEQERITQGSRNWNALFQQRPRPQEGALFKVGKIKVVDALPAGLRFARGWDLAATEETGKNDPDWTVGAKVGISPDKRLYIADVCRGRWGPRDVEQTLCGVASQDGYSVPIGLRQDPGQAGKAQVQYLVGKLAGYIVVSIPETGSKETRAMPLAAQMEAGNVYMLRASWNADFFEELRSFPSGSHDDQVDGAAWAYSMLTTNTLGLLDFYRRQHDAQAQAQAEKIDNIKLL